jgi:MFS family permease
VPVLPVVVGTGLLSGVAHGFLYPALAALVADDAPPARRGAVIGVFSALFLAGQAGGAFTFGGFAHGFGYPLMWLVLTAGVVAGAVISVGLPRPAAATP